MRAGGALAAPCSNVSVCEEELQCVDVRTQCNSSDLSVVAYPRRGSAAETCGSGGIPQEEGGVEQAALGGGSLSDAACRDGTPPRWVGLEYT